MTEEIDYRALFIGDKAENKTLYKELLNKLVDDHIGWRENYIPEDIDSIPFEAKETVEFKQTTNRMVEVIEELSKRMRSGSIPWNSPRYWGQMNSETLMPSLLAYNFAMLWNPNNVALESSMATSQMELEVGQDFSTLFSQPQGWGHISADGSIANLEGLWYARCIKSIPLAVKEVFPEKLNKTEWELLNLSVEEILDLVETLTAEELDAVKAASSRSGKNIQKLGKWLVPQTKHYSWLKALDISGVGLDQMVPIPVQANYRMNYEILDQTIKELTDKQIPILGVVSVVGTTEEGQVDNVDKIVEIREKYKKQGIYFYLHVDAAYGGYTRSIFLDENNEFIPYDKLQATFDEHNVFTSDEITISEDVYNAYKAISEAESITIDPHKMGYVPYSAGGIAIKYKNMRNIISYFAPYVFEKSVKAPDLLGAFILEGSKAGATAAAVWTAHRVLPLNVTGYGKLIGSTIEAAQRFRNYLSTLSFNVGGKVVKVYPLNHPDFNMVDWVFKVDGEDSLAATNEINEKMFDLSSYMDGPVYGNRFITSHTSFDNESYGDSPKPFIERMGFTDAEWDKVGTVTLIRACILTPYFSNEKVFNYYTKGITEAMEKRLNEILG